MWNIQNIVMNMYEKFHDDWSRNDGALGDRKSGNNNPNKNNVRNAWSLGAPVLGLQISSHYRPCSLDISPAQLNKRSKSAEDGDAALNPNDGGFRAGQLGL